MSKDLILQYIAAHGYIAIWTAFFFELLALPLPGEGVMAYIGYLVYQGELSLVKSILSVSFGAMAGISVSYFLGLKLGRPLIHNYGRFIGIDPEKFNKVSDWFDLYGNKILVFAYFVPGLRHISGYMSGILKLPARLFAFNAFLGAFFYATIFVCLGRYLGPDWGKLFTLIKTHINLAAAGLILLWGTYLLGKYRRRKAP